MDPGLSPGGDPGSGGWYGAPLDGIYRAVDFSLLESVPDAIIIADREGLIIYVNGVGERLFGYEHEELVGKPIEVLLPSRFRQMHQVYRGGYHGAPRTRPMGLGLDLFGLKKTGEEFHAEISLSPLRAGDDTWAVSAIRDVTERKKIEARAGMYRKAQAEVRERDEFLSIASHELRTPVTALQLQLQMLQRVADRQHVEWPQAMVGKVGALERQTRRIALLVNELLDVSRIRLGRLELKLEELDLGEVAREAVAHLEEEGARSGSAITLVTKGPAPGRWDRLRLEQVITNLLSNAIKFGEGKPITVEVDSDGTRARMVVRDRGIGVDEDDRQRIFSRFERAVPSQHFGGLGLGLYIARQIVEAHGGVIDVDGSPGDGTAFRVDLPRVARPPPAPAMPN
jgi:two-component system, LuxR family, sensor kinase FixL